MLPTPTRVVLLVFVIILAGCGGGGSPPDGGTTSSKPASKVGASARSQVLITVESFAGRRVVPFGGTIAMPRLMELAATGVTYDDAVSATPVTRPSVVSILTGVSPDRSGIRDNIHDALGPGLPTLAEGAHKAGYETVAFVSSPFTSYSSGLQRGFDLFDGPEAITVGPAQHAPPVVKAPIVADHFKEWLSTRDATRPYFVWVHFADLNALSATFPFQKVQMGETPPSEFAAYDSALGAIDTAIGMISDAVKQGQNGAAVDWLVAGTHGTCLGEDGRFGDAFWLIDETLRVPLVRVAGATPKTGHDARPTWLPDVAATLAAAMGFPLDPSADGVKLDEAPPADRQRLAWDYAPDDQLGWAPLAAIRDGQGFKPLTGATARPALPRQRVLPAASRAAIEAAGFKVAAVTVEVPPPKVNEWLKQLQLVRRYLAGDRPGLAGQESKKVLATTPNALGALTTRAWFYTAEVRKDGPELQRKLVTRFSNRSDALHWAAHIALVEGKHDVAAMLLDAAIAVGPVEPEMRYDLACVKSLRGDPRGALAELDKALSTGYRNWDWIDKDPDLSAARSDPGFPALLRTHGR